MYVVSMRTIFSIDLLESESHLEDPECVSSVPFLRWTFQIASLLEKF